MYNYRTVDECGLCQIRREGWNDGNKPKGMTTFVGFGAVIQPQWLSRAWVDQLV